MWNHVRVSGAGFRLDALEPCRWFRKVSDAAENAGSSPHEQNG